eukprot:TRINITY_DN3023_c0_g1_i5.p1 TRINITY_DN3023_c0_g1~~TRINITY_DN3023_c0_g1_i5.p1  ORF type:complete len:183 (-),score=32.45 TRINITY_DN3023_c0_g1_i5:231-779(-)
MRQLESKLSTAFLEVVNAMKGGFIFHIWQETLSVPENSSAESRDNDCEVSGTMRTAYIAKIRFDLEHNKTVQWYFTKNEFYRCTVYVDFKIIYLNVGIVNNMVRTNTLQIIKNTQKQEMKIVCRSFTGEGTPISLEYSFNSDDTRRIEHDVESFKGSNLLGHSSVPSGRNESSLTPSTQYNW